MVSDSWCLSEAPTELVSVAGENCEVNVVAGVRVVEFSNRGVVLVACDVAVFEVLVVVREDSEEQ